MATACCLHKHSLLFHCIHSASRKDYVPKKITCRRLYENQTIFIISAHVFFDTLPEYIHAILICLRGTFVAYNKGKKGSLERCDVCGTRSDMFTAIRVCFFFFPPDDPVSVSISMACTHLPTPSVLLTMTARLKYDMYI